MTATQGGDAIVELRYMAARDGDSSFTLLLERGALHEIERCGWRERRSSLGVVGPVDANAIANAVRDAGADVDQKPGGETPTGPAYTLIVTPREGSARAKTVIDAENIDEEPIGKVVRLLYGIAVRFGPKPLELAARKEDAIVELANQRMTFAAFARWLAEHRALWVPAEKTEGGGHRPRIASENGTHVLSVFTKEAAFDAWRAGPGASAEAAVLSDTNGCALFGGMPDFIARVDVDPASPITLQIHGEPLRMLRAVARGVGVERDPAKTIDGAELRVALKMTGPGEAAILTVPGPNGEPLVAAFTADDCAAAFVEKAPGSQLATMKGADVFASLAFLGAQGILLNAAGPGARAVVPRR